MQTLDRSIRSAKDYVCVTDIFFFQNLGLSMAFTD
jgi:hypothetical protein